LIQEIVWDSSIVLMAALAALFAWVAAGADVALTNYGPTIASAYRLRGWLFAVALLVLLGFSYRSLIELPYVSFLPRPMGPVESAFATGEQWAWAVSPNAFRVGQTVEFQVTSKDVNHGFALYDPGMRIVAQTQAMPGYTNILRYTFSQPGTYHVLCLEFCGLAHHDMKADITVAQ
jgi:cytochrome c oxidase subunit II